MRYLSTIAVLLLTGAGAGKPSAESASGNSPLARAENLIDSFYSFDSHALQMAMADAPDSQPQILYYQGWAEGGNYAVVHREPCEFVEDTEAVCKITVRDDLIVALGTSYWVTDSFHLTFDDGLIVKVSTSSNDPPDFGQALDWLQAERPEIMSGPCRGFFAGGPTPQACVRAVVGAFKAYRATKQPD